MQNTDKEQVLPQDETRNIVERIYKATDSGKAPSVTYSRDYLEGLPIARCSHCKCNRAMVYEGLDFFNVETHRCIACGHIYKA